MKTLQLISHDKPAPEGAVLVKNYINPVFEVPEIYWIWEGYLILSLGTDQLELPLSSVWPVFDQIRLNLRPEDPARERPWKQKFTFNGEVVGYSRGMCLGGEGVAGYVVFNLSRRSYINSRSAQVHDFYDCVMFTDGILDFLLELGKPFKDA